MPDLRHFGDHVSGQRLYSQVSFKTFDSFSEQIKVRHGHVEVVMVVAMGVFGITFRQNTVDGVVQRLQAAHG